MFTAIITFVAVLAVIVIVHEFGHFITAKKAGARVEEFGFGFPPRIAGMYKDPDSGKLRVVGKNTTDAPSTIYSFNWIPLGGFVRIKGEQGDSAEEKDSFSHLSIGRRMLVISAGVTMNVLLAAILLSFAFVIGFPQEIGDEISRSATIKDEQIYISQVFEGYPAAEENIEAGDILIAADSQTFTSVDEFQEYINSRLDQEILLTIERDDEKISVPITPTLFKEENRAILGISLLKIGKVSYPAHIALYEGVKTSLFLLKEIVFALFMLIKNFLFEQKVSVDFSGPVGIAVISSQVARLGFVYLLQFTALLSLNLAIINFLPLPALDGGRMVFLLIEKIRGKPINSRTESMIHNIGFYMLIFLVLVVTYRDIIRYSGSFSAVWSKITSIF